MSTPLLTIAVPTYNRADCLELLLTTLERELSGLEGRVAVVVCDNASSDRTPAVMAAFAQSWRDTRLLRQEKNLGMDGNFCACAQAVETPYFWVLGDDDLPRAGLLRVLLPLLERDTPSLVYMESRWMAEIRDNDPAHPVDALDAVLLGQQAFARRAHVWTTYLSGMIVRGSPLLKDPVRLRRHAGTQLSQLAWVLEALRDGERFIHVRTPCVLATQGNTGGYSVLQVFGNNFPAIVRAELGADSVVARIIIGRYLLLYLPYLVWNLRFGQVGKFDAEDFDAALRPQLGDRLAFWLVLRPLHQWPKAAAVVVLRACQLVAKVLNLVDRMRQRIRPPRKAA